MFCHRVLAALAPLLLAACTPAAPEGATLRVITTADPAPLIAAATRTGLTARDSAGQVVPGLARSWRIADDGLSIVFRLRPAAWPDGTKLTAAEIARTLDAARARGPMAPFLAGVDASAPLPDVVELSLSAPRPELLEILSSPALTPRRRGQGLAAFTLAGANRIERSTAWPGEQPALAAVTFTRLPRDEAVAAFAVGRADLVLGEGTPPNPDAVPARTLRVAPGRATLLLLANWNAAPTRDPAVRAALSLAIDRVGLGQSLGGAAVARGLVPPSLDAAPTDPVAPFVSDQERARALLAGRTPEVTLAAAPEDRPIADRLSSDWAAVGFRVRIVLGEPAQTLDGRRAQLALVTRTAPADTPLAFLAGFRCGANRQRVCSPEADAALDRAARAPTPTERAAAFAEADAALTAAGAAIPLAQPMRWALVSPRLAGWVDNRVGVHPFAAMDLLPERRFLPR